jgi:uncharacterized protein YoxC
MSNEVSSIRLTKLGKKLKDLNKDFLAVEVEANEILNEIKKTNQPISDEMFAYKDILPHRINRISRKVNEVANLSNNDPEKEKQIDYLFKEIKNLEVTVSELPLYNMIVMTAYSVEINKNKENSKKTESQPGESVN